MKGQIYTAGDWLAKEGQEEEFIKSWTAFAKWTAKNVPGSGDFRLLQDAKDSRHFISFGSWDSPEAVTGWRQLPEFKQFMAKNKEVCDKFAAGNYNLRVSSSD